MLSCTGGGGAGNSTSSYLGGLAGTGSPTECLIALGFISLGADGGFGGGGGTGSPCRYPGAGGGGKFHANFSAECVLTILHTC